MANPTDQQHQGELITPHSPPTVVVPGSPPVEDHHPPQQTTFYLQRDKVIVQQQDRENSVIQPVVQPGDKGQEKGETLTLLAPVEVVPGEGSPHDVERQRELEVIDTLS